MSDSVLKKYIVGKPIAAEPALAPEAESLDDLGAFGFLRGIRDRAIMLEIRHKDGKVSAFGYAWLHDAEFDPSDGITLHFGGTTVRIIGRNLNAEVRPSVRLVQALIRHRVPWLQEADQPAAIGAGRETVVIDAIKIDP